jgi:uncharacterized membrane protein
MAAVDLSQTDAEMIMDSLKAMHRAANIDLVDAAIVSRDSEEKVHVQETRELTGRKGAKRGVIVGGLLGLVFPPSLIGTALVGGGIGAVAGKLRDTGIKTDRMQQIAESLHPGEYAVIALADPESMQRVEGALSAHGHLIQQELSSPEAEAIGQVADEVDASSTE